MDDVLSTLRAAFAASPTNLKLLVGILQTLGNDADEEALRAALELSQVPKLELVGADEKERLILAAAMLRGGQADSALELCQGETAEFLVLKARSLMALSRQDEARNAYTRGVEKNPTLEDTELESLLKAKIRTVDRGGPALRVIANDDTDDDVLTRLVAPEQERVSFSDVGGLADIKKQIERKIILPFKKPSMFQRFKRKAGGGILLYGPPGCGKTLLARATAGECNAQFFNIAISDVLDMYIGESERKLHALFEKARSSAPSVVFFDELEGLAGKRQYSREGTSAKLVSQFLSEMDGFSQDNSGVLILAATNVPWAVDAAFRRPGRFDRVLFVPPPDAEARAQILSMLLDDVPTSGDLDIPALAKKTSGFSGADLKNLVETASDEAIELSLEEGTEHPVGPPQLKLALEQVRSTTMEWLTTARNYARYANESGQYDEVLAFLNRHGKNK